MRTHRMTTYSGAFPADEYVNNPDNAYNGLPDDVSIVYDRARRAMVATVRRHVIYGLPSWMLATHQGTPPPYMAPGEFTAWLECVKRGVPSCYYDFDELLRIETLKSALEEK